jgi:hypothetical protein
VGFEERGRHIARARPSCRSRQARGSHRSKRGVGRGALQQGLREKHTTPVIK